MTEPNADGQPNRAFHYKRLVNRSVDELIGICRGVLADGLIADDECAFLMKWMDNNRELAGRWPAKVLYERLNLALTDGQIDAYERGELIDLLMKMTGGGLSIKILAHSESTTLPLNDPEPEVIFEGKCFCLTGKFVTGTRKYCQELIAARGGAFQERVTQGLDYLTIGVIGSRDWIHSSYGRKIEEAVALRERKLPIAIISEQHWATALGLTGQN